MGVSMSIIVKMINDMDGLLRAVADCGRVPERFILQEDEWAEIRERLQSDRDASEATLGDTFRGVPVEFRAFTSPCSVGIICREGNVRRL